MVILDHIIASRGNPLLSMAGLNFVHSQYVEMGERELDSDKLPELFQRKYGSSDDAVKVLGSVAEFCNAFRQFQSTLYKDRVRGLAEHKRGLND